VEAATFVHLANRVEMSNTARFKILCMSFQVWQTVRTQHDVVSALVAISNEGTVDQSIHDWNRADRVCLVGLRHLTEFSPKSINLDDEPAGDKALIIVTALMKLLREGKHSLFPSLLHIQESMRDFGPYAAPLIRTSSCE